MRIALWLLVLVTVCAGLLLWNERVTVEARAERDQLRGGRAPTGGAGDGFDHAIVGEKSGAPLLEVAPLPAPPPGVVPGSDPNRRNESGPDRHATAPQAATEHVVAAGESLSTICQAQYGTSKPDVVAAVARANKLEKPGQIKAGMKLVLPPLSELSKYQR
jgi:nucleoid-associated protein YgaU